MTKSVSLLERDIYPIADAILVREDPELTALLPEDCGVFGADVLAIGPDVAGVQAGAKVLLMEGGIQISDVIFTEYDFVLAIVR